MSDLISRSALIEFARNHFGGEIDCNDIARFPTIDAVPVVRCRECQEIEPCLAVNDGYSWCNAWGTVVSLDGFCYKGAKMDGGADG